MIHLLKYLSFSGKIYLFQIRSVFYTEDGVDDDSGGLEVRELVQRKCDKGLASVRLGYTALCNW